LFDKEKKIWTKMEEDQQVQKWDKEKERISISIEELKQRKKKMSITERANGARDMKKL